MQVLQNKSVVKIIYSFEVIIIRSSNLAWLVIIAALFCLTGGLLSHVSGDMRLSPKPSHTVMRDWKATNGRRFDAAGCKISESTTLRTVVNADCSALCMIIKSRNLAITAYTKGKIIYSTDGRGLSLSGTRVTVIPLSDLKSGAELTLCLDPGGKSGCVISPIYIGANNDMLLTLIMREKKCVFALFAMCAAVILTVAKILRAKRKTAPLLCLLGAELTLFTALLCGNDIAQFFIGSSLARLVLFYISATVTPLLFLLFCALLFIQKLLRLSYYQ